MVTIAAIIVTVTVLVIMIFILLLINWHYSSCLLIVTFNCCGRRCQLMISIYKSLTAITPIGAAAITIATAGILSTIVPITG